MYFDDERDVITKLIKNNNIIKLKNYIESNHIELSELNNSNFDILIFSIKNTNLPSIVKYIINQCQYKSLNYTFIDRKLYNKNFINGKNKYNFLKIPLFYSIAIDNIKISDLLIKQADINFLINDFCGNTINVIQYLSYINELNIKNLKYILNNGFSIVNINDTLINTLINYKHGNKIDLLECIFEHYLLDNAFILNLIYNGKNKIAFSKKQLQDVYNKERKKIEITNFAYSNAVNEDNYEALKILFKYDGDEYNKLLNKIEKYRLLEFAIEEEDYDFVKKILNFEAFDFQYTDIESVIIKASKICNVAIVKLIVEKLNNQNCDFKINNFEKIFLEATQFNHYNYYYNNSILEFLIEKLLNIKSGNFENIDVSSIKNKNSSFLSLLLNVAIKIGNLKLIQCLLNHPELKSMLNINMKDNNNEYPIMMTYYASSYYSTENNAMESFINSMKIFEYLLDHGANYNEKDRGGNSLLLLAIQNKKYIIAKYLLKYNINISKEDANEIYPLSLIEIIYQNKIDAFKFKIKNQFNIRRFNSNIPIKIKANKFYFNPLVFAYLLNRQEIFKILLNYCDINELDFNGYSVLHYAILKEDIETVNHLISIGAEVNFKKNKFGRGNSPLDIAIQIKNKNILYLLLNHKDILLNIPNEYGKIPLMTIIECNNYTVDEKKIIIDYLVKRGADINYIDRHKNSPLMYAAREGSLSLIKLLIEYGANTTVINKD